MNDLRERHAHISKEKEDLASDAAASGDDLLKRNEAMQEELRRAREEGERAAAALQWLDDLGDPYIVSVVDRSGSLGLDLGVYGAPETYFVDAGGTVRYRHVGVIDERIWRTRLAQIYEELGGAVTAATGGAQ